MKKQIGGSATLILLFLFGCGREDVDPSRFPIIPFPAEVEAGTGAFQLDRETRVTLSDSLAEQLTGLVEGWAARGREAYGLPLPVTLDKDPTAPGSITIRLEDGRSDPGPTVPAGMGLPGTTTEKYELQVARGGITLTAAGHPGIFYGLETLGQLMESSFVGGDAPLMIPAVDIEDTPRFKYRGMHLDVGRHFFPVSFIKRYLDLLAAYKMNVFHWHLTEDQGWRLEIREYPRLTEVGSCREETILEKNFDPYVGDGIPHCGFYTQEEAREIVEYARERFITVIPEIEMPGHSVAALAAYPELACTPGPFEVATIWGVKRDIYCPKEETFAFLEHVLTEVMDIFPSPYIHIGGDEAPKDRWEESEAAQAVMEREGLADEHELQSWFIRRIEAFLNDHGRSLMGWDEILEGGLAPNATVMSWRGMDGGIQAAREGHDVVMTPTSHVYFDYYQGDTIQEPLAIGGMATLERVYDFEPVPPDLSAGDGAHILGGQGNVWTEYMKTAEYVEYMVLPRMLALSEVIWSPKELRNWVSFSRRLPTHLSRLDRWDVNYRIPDVSGLDEGGLTLGDSVVVRLAAPIAGDILYSLDGTEPGPGGPRYQSPLVLPVDRTGTTVAGRVVLPDGRTGAVRQARFAKTDLMSTVPLPISGRIRGLSVLGFRGDFSSVDSLERGDSIALPHEVEGESRWGSPTRAVPSVPRVGVPRGTPQSGFGLELSGFIRVPRQGIYTFYLSSDDGSRLEIGGRVVVDHDGYHSESVKTGQVGLRRGWHPISVRYFQGGGGMALRLEVEGPGVSKRDVPAHWLAHRPDEAR
jgi:hexosaminidase